MTILNAPASSEPPSPSEQQVRTTRTLPTPRPVEWLSTEGDINEGYDPRGFQQTSEPCLGASTRRMTHKQHCWPHAPCWPHCPLLAAPSLVPLPPARP